MIFVTTFIAFLTHLFTIKKKNSYLVGCDNMLVRLHTKHPELCDKVGGLLAMHMDDLRVLAPLWLSKTEDVRQDTAHWSTNLTGDVYGKGWISEMYGYSFGAAEVNSPSLFLLLLSFIFVLISIINNNKK